MTQAASKGETRFSRMAHLFLSDIRSATPDTQDIEKRDPLPGGKIKRIKPGERNGFDFPVPVPPAESVEEASETAESVEKKLHILGVHSDHLHEAGNQVLEQFARTLAGQGNLVAVLTLEAGAAHLRRYSRRSEVPPQNQSMAALSEPVLDESSDEPGGVWGILEAQVDQLDYFLIGWSPEFGPYEDRLYSLVDELCIVTSPKPECLIDTYQRIKSLKSRPAMRSVGIFVGQVGSFSEAQAVYSKLARTSREFAGLEVENFGYTLGDEAVAGNLVARTPVRDRQERWFEELEKWLENHRESRPGDAVEDLIEKNIKKEETIPPPSVIARSAATKQSGLIDQESQIASSSTPRNDPEGPEPLPSEKKAEDEDNLIFEDVPDKAPAAELIAGRLFPTGTPANDSLMIFLRSIGLDAGRVINGDGRGAVVLVLKSEEDSSLASWAMQHYPVREDKLVLVTDKQIGQMERTLWQKYCSTLEIKRLLRGKLHGRQILIVEK